MKSSNQWTFIKNSAKSRVRGTLDIYHAFIRDLDDNSETVTPPESPTPPESATPPEWDIVNSPTSVSSFWFRHHCPISLDNLFWLHSKILLVRIRRLTSYLKDGKNDKMLTVERTTLIMLPERRNGNALQCKSLSFGLWICSIIVVRK